MNKRFLPPWIALVAASLIPLIGLSQEEESAHTVGCLPKTTVQDPSSVCAGCHQDSASRWESNQYHPCTPYCKSCHEKMMDRHHHVDIKLPKRPDEVLKLAAEMKIACFTCHDVSRPRYDSVRWKAASLYDRLFHTQKLYKTYFLSERNEQGQLCLSCH